MPNRSDKVSFGPGHGHRFLRALVVIMALVTAAAFAARVGWPFELLSHFRPHFAVISIALLASAVAMRTWKIAALALAVVLVHLSYMWPEWTASRELQATPAGALRIYYANVRSHNLQIGKVMTQIGKEEPDIAVLLETDDRWLEALEDLKGMLPYRTTHPRPDNFGMTVLSKNQPRRAEVIELGGVQVPAISLEIEHGDREFQIFAVHTIPPASSAGLADRDSQLEDLARRVGAATLPVIVVGDLNCSPWAPAFETLLRTTQLRDSRKGFGVSATWPAFMGSFGIPIDHALVDPILDVYERRIGDAMGSDHLPINLLIGERRFD